MNTIDQKLALPTNLVEQIKVEQECFHIILDFNGIKCRLKYIERVFLAVFMRHTKIFLRRMCQFSNNILRIYSN